MYIDKNGIQFSRRDTWDYTTLGQIMVSWLEAFKRHENYGCPTNYLPIRENGEYSDADIEQGLEKFLSDIDKLIWALQDNEPDLEGSTEEWLARLDGYNSKRKEALAIFHEIYPLLWR